MDLVGVRVQNLGLSDQVLTIARLAEARSEDASFGPTMLDSPFDELTLPRPAKVANQLAALKSSGLATNPSRGVWRLTPRGRQRSQELTTDMDLAALATEAAATGVTRLADTPHPVIPPSLAPPELVLPLQAFFADHPFERNVFGMTRFPGAPENGELDPIAPALKLTRSVCELHGLEFHVASDRQIVDDLWPNVAAHLWGSQFTIAFFENRTDKGLNYNLTIEVGSAMVLGRRMALLKDEPVKSLPTDLVGRIYKEVDLSKPATVGEALHLWMRDDLALGACRDCPRP